VDFCEFLSPTAEEKAARDMAIESVFGVIKHIWPHCQVSTLLVIALHHFVVEFYVSMRFLFSSFLLLSGGSVWVFQDRAVSSHQ